MYNKNSYTNNTADNASDTFDDDDYLMVQPYLLHLCSDSSCQGIIETVNLTQVSVNANSVASSYYNGDSAYAVNYTLSTADKNNNTVDVL